MQATAIQNKSWPVFTHTDKQRWRLTALHVSKTLLVALLKVLVRLGTSVEEWIRAGPVLATPLLVNTGTLLVGMVLGSTAVLFTLLFTKEAGVVAAELGTV